MKILITGATGFIGKALCKKLIANGYSIHYLTTSKSKISNETNLKGFYWNIATQEIDLNCFDGVEKIIHLAGATIAKRWTKSYKKEIIDSRVLGCKLIYDALTKTKNTVNQFISASGIDIYPDRDSQVFNENSKEINPNFLGKVVQLWEKTATTFSELNITVTIVRTGLVYDKTEGAFPEIVNPIRKGFGAILGNGNQNMAWVHIQDLVAIYQCVLENKISGIVNATAPVAISNKDFTKKIAHFYGKKIWLPNVPKFIIKLFLGEMHQLLFSNKKVTSKVLERHSFTFKYTTFDEVLSK